MEIEHDEGAAARALAAKLHAGPLRIAMAVTGGGSLAGAALLTTPGASRTVLEFRVPYSTQATAELLGKAPESYCSAPTARAMGAAMLERARKLSSAADESRTEGAPIGVGATCALSTGRERRGAERIHVALQTLDETRVWSATLAKVGRTRIAEERLAAAAILNLLAERSGVSPLERLPLPLVEGDVVEDQTFPAGEHWKKLREGRSWATRHPPAGAAPADAATGVAAAQGRVLFPGSFHPRHAGHTAMAEAARKRLGREVEYEISLRNVDKPPLDYADLALRARQFTEDSLWFTDAPRFTDKARIFPGSTFVVGADTIERIGDPKYYDGRTELRDAALAALAAAGASFLVFGRLRGDAFQTLADLSLPPALRERCQGVSAEEFRVDLSSTELRTRAPG